MNQIKKFGLWAVMATFFPSLLWGQDLKTGPFEIETIQNKHFLYVADSILNRDILVITRIAKGPSFQNTFQEKKLYPGNSLFQTTIRFEKTAEGRLQMKEIKYKQRGPAPTEPLARAMELTNTLPILAHFEKLPSERKGFTKVDFSDLILGDQAFMGVDKYTKSSGKLESFQPSKSGFIRQERFPEGLDLRISKTYASEQSAKTMELNTTFLLLPEVPMVPRLADDRVTAMGFNTVNFVDFADNPLYSVKKRFAYRYRLEPAEKDKEAYQKGKLVAPQKPIVFYLDPNIPTEWIPYFKKGVSMWEKTFEKAGFKNAIQLKMAPQSEKEFNYISARYNTIDYLNSETYGGSADMIMDDRSGEVIVSRIRMPHSNPAFHRNRYMVLAGALDTGARKAQFSIELAGEITASVVAHELGHCLGIHHNYLSSRLVPVEKLRDKQWVEKNGFSPSIMDYSRHNYVAQPEDKIGRAGLIPTVGAYDYWAIEWLYTWYKEQEPYAEKAKLNTLYNRKVKENPLLQYINIDWYLEDHRLMMEDVGDDPIKASEYGLKNIRYMIPHILDWTQSKPGFYDYTVAFEVYLEVYTQLQHFSKHVMNLVGGRTLDVNEENQRTIQNWVSKTQQKKAIEFMGQSFLQNQDWLLHPSLLKAFSSVQMSTSPMERYLNFVNQIFDLVFDSRRWNEMRKALLVDSQQYSVDEMLTDIERFVFGNDQNESNGSFAKRMIQNTYLKKLSTMDSKISNWILMQEEKLVINKHLQSIQKTASERLDVDKDPFSQLHFQNIISGIDTLFIAK